MIYNILDGGTGRIDPICHVIGSAHPDIVLLCEATDHMQTMTIARKLEMAVFPAQLPNNPRGAVALLSRWEIAQAVNWGAINPKEKSAALIATVRKSDRDVVVVGSHFAYACHGDDERRQLETIIASAAPAGQRQTDMLLLIGDATDEGSQKQDGNVGEAKASPSPGTAPLPPVKAAENGALAFLEQHGWIDTHIAESNGSLPTPNYPTYKPTSRADRIFVKNTPYLRIESSRVIQNPLARFASDHYPVVADVAF